MLKLPDQKQLGEEFIVPHPGKSEQELQKPWKRAAYWLAQFVIL